MIEVNKDNFEQEVINSNKPVIVDFWGPSCQPCLELLPQVEKLSEAYKDKVKLVKVNSAGNRRLCIKLRVMGLPSFLAFKNGKEVKRISGQDLTIKEIEELIKSIA
ncbi:MAG TPA: thioredoxin [Thermoanaerobacterales bacterium]|jgi:thioredoxin 1|nr:thioredoxin [Thermoanaerobacterales bacterium]